MAKDKKKNKKSKGKQKLEAELAPVAVATGNNLDGAREAVLVEPAAGTAAAPAAAEPGGKMSRKDFEKAMEPLQVELVKLQEWVKANGAKICVLFEGRDAAGKGGVIKRMTERTSPRTFRVVALAAPTEREKSQMYFQRYIPHLPAAGEVVLFDRSWYNQAGVERVMGYASLEQVEYFLKYTPALERAIILSGIHLIKYWLEESMENQTKRQPKGDYVEPNYPFRYVPEIY